MCVCRVRLGPVKLEKLWANCKYKIPAKMLLSETLTLLFHEFRVTAKKSKTKNFFYCSVFR